MISSPLSNASASKIYQNELLVQDTRAESVRRLVGMGLRFGVKPGDKVSTPVGSATIQEIMTSLGRVTVITDNGDGHNFALSEINTLNDDS